MVTTVIALLSLLVAFLFLFLVNFCLVCLSILLCFGAKEPRNWCTKKNVKMNAVPILFAFLVINQLFLPCLAFRSSRGGGKYTNSKTSQTNAPKTFTGTSSGLPSQNTARRGLGLSAWGIVAVIITLIAAGTGFYYFSMCYPILCKKERKYDMIGLPSVA